MFTNIKIHVNEEKLVKRLPEAHPGYRIQFIIVYRLSFITNKDFFKVFNIKTHAAAS